MRSNQGRCQAICCCEGPNNCYLAIDLYPAQWLPTEVQSKCESSNGANLLRSGLRDNQLLRASCGINAINIVVIIIPTSSINIGTNITLDIANIDIFIIHGIIITIVIIVMTIVIMFTITITILVILIIIIAAIVVSGKCRVGLSLKQRSHYV